MAQYFIYTINDVFSIGVRSEIRRDPDGFYVASFAENEDVLDGLGGDGTLNDTHPFSDSSNRNQFIAGIDVIIGF